MTGSEYDDDVKKEEVDEMHDTIVLQKVRVESLDKAIHYDKFKGKSINCEDFIRFFGVKRLCLSPFYSFYWTKQQIELWNKLCDLSLPLCFDATGGVAIKYKLYSSEKRKTIFYYVLTIGFKEKNFAINASHFDNTSRWHNKISF